MIQDHNQNDYSLEELINLVNHKDQNNSKALNQPLHPHPKSNKDINGKHLALPPLESRVSGLQPKNVCRPKTLVFKPWSGSTGFLFDSPEYNTTEPIREQIQNQELEDGIIGGEDNEKEDYIDDTKTLSNYASTSEIGYFYRFQNGKVRLIKCLLDENGFKDCGVNSSQKNWTIYWSSSVIKQEIYRNLLPYQKVNHFPNSFYITRKDLMNKAISKMQAKFGITHFNFLPKTYILPQETDQLLRQMDKQQTFTYIVKPHNRSQGKGITVTSSLDVIYSKLQKYSSVIVSHYIDNPLLINKLKFDLRIYVAVTGVNPLRIFVYEEGLARFATEQYDQSAADSENKKFQHLTNYSVNKKNIDFIKSQTDQEEYYGSKWSLTALKDFLAYNIGRQETSDLFERIDDVLIKTILSVENTLYTAFHNNVAYINGCFQVFGFDIMVDSNLKPWLIEVNMSPSMNTDSPLDLKIKGNMIADLYTMVGFVPLTQRYLDGGHSRYESRHYFKPDDIRRDSSAVDKFIVKEVELESERSGAWRRVFPHAKNTKYKMFFQKDRYFNRLLREKLLPAHRQHPASMQPTRTANYRTSTVQKREIAPNNKIYSNKKISMRIVRNKKGTGSKNTSKSYETNFVY